MIRAQQESINTHKQTLSQLLKDKKKPKAKTPSKKSKGNRRNERAYPLQTQRMKSIPTLSHPSLHLKRRITQRMGAIIPKG